MARRKRTSSAIDKAKLRINSMKSIDAALDLGSGLTVASYKTQIDSTQAALDLYNQTLSSIDDLLNDVVAKEKVLATLNERMLTGVATKFGKDSSQYEQAGGTRASERKKPKRAPKPPKPPKA